MCHQTPAYSLKRPIFKNLEPPAAGRQGSRTGTVFLQGTVWAAAGMRVPNIAEAGVHSVR